MKPVDAESVDTEPVSKEPTGRTSFDEEQVDANSAPNPPAKTAPTAEQSDDYDLPASESAFGDTLPAEFYDDPTIDVAPIEADDVGGADFDRLGEDTSGDSYEAQEEDTHNAARDVRPNEVPSLSGGDGLEHPHFATLQSLFPGYVVDVQPLTRKKKTAADAGGEDDPNGAASDLTENDAEDALN